MHEFCNRLWYGHSKLYLVLTPISVVFKYIADIRRFFLKRFFQRQFSVPIIVVGNISVGGVGKTPLVITMANALKERGHRPGIISRGYKAKINAYPHRVKLTDSAIDVGDEPLMMARNTMLPVIISPKRVDSVDALIADGCDVIISDDGLQHYKMGRAIEIAVVDSQRALGNGWCLPAGPLRESKNRLNQVDYVIENGSDTSANYVMTLTPDSLVHLKSGKMVDYNRLLTPIHAVAGIGNPERFFSTLKSLGFKISEHVFNDHHRYSYHELQFGQGSVIMTEKDAVKCQDFDDDSIYYLKVKACIDNNFIDNLVQRITKWGEQK
jgi:tetraacyldisaccharide 4'-kinase